MMPTIRPNVAPTAMDGTKMPAGTLQPYEMMTRPMRTTVASSSELTMGHCAEVLQGRTVRQPVALYTHTHRPQRTGTAHYSPRRPRTP